MSQLAQSLEHARLAIEISGKKQFTGLNTLNHVILVCLNYHTVMIQQSQNFYSDEIEQILWCWFKIISSCIRPNAAVFGLYVYLYPVQSLNQQNTIESRSLSSGDLLVYALRVRTCQPEGSVR